VVVSLENLITFPFVRNAVESGLLGLHGIWVDIATGELQVYDSETQGFATV